MIKRLEIWLYHPSKVAFVTLFFAVAALTLDGSLFRLHAMSNERDQIQREIHEIGSQIAGLRVQSAGANDPHHIERDARERFDLVEKNDLLFVFSENE